jgi:hypothetical protein
MELNHQPRLCRPSPFRFGFRAILRRPTDYHQERKPGNRIRSNECNRAGYVGATIFETQMGLS